MVIVLLLFVLLFFPIKITSKVNVDIKNAYFYVGLFILKFPIIDFQIVNYKNKLYYVIGRFEPKPIIINENNNKKNSVPMRYDFFRGEKVMVTAKIGTFSPSLTTSLTILLGIIIPPICQIIDERVYLDILPDYIDKNVKVFTNLTGFTSMGIIIFQFIKRKVKGVKNVTQQSN